MVDLLNTCISVISEIESPQREPDVNQKETKRKRVETEIQKSKRKKPNEYSQSPKKTNGKPEELDKRNNSTRIKLDSCKGLLSKTSRKKETALSTTCKGETEALEDPDVLMIDDGEESPSERSIPGKSDLLLLILEHFCVLNLSSSLLFNTCSCNIQLICVYKTSGSLTNDSFKEYHI